MPKRGVATFWILISLLILISICFYSAIKIKAASFSPIRAGEIKQTNFKNPLENPLSPDFVNIKNISALTLDRNSDGNYQTQKIYLSQILRADFEFNALALNWQAEQPAGTKIEFKIRFLGEATWRDILPLEDFKDGFVPDGFWSELIFADSAQLFQYQAILSTSEPQKTPQLNSVEFVYIDSSSGPKLSQSQITATAPTIIPRAGWGADESLMTWPPEYAVVNKEIVHHTVTANGAEPMSTIRSIYYYHAVTLGWGDIGYNYLVDQFGNIYEGRYGGNRVIGGHTYGYNAGSVGIAVLGTYSDVPINSSSFNSLATLAAWKAYENHIGINLFGHRDFQATACPGNAFYAQLPALRVAAQNKLNEFLQYALITSDQTTKVYLLYENKKYWITSPDVFNDWGFSWSSILWLPDETLQSYNDGDNLTNLSQGLGDPDGKVYYMENGVRRWIVDRSTFDAWNFQDSDISDLPYVFLMRYSVGSNITRLVTTANNSKVYYVESGQKRWITSPAVFNAWGFSWSNICWVRSALLNTLSQGSDMGRIAKDASENLYLIDLGQKRKAQNQILSAWGFDSSSAISSDRLNILANGGDLTIIASALGQARVFLIDLGKKRWIINPETFSAWNFSLANISWVSLDFLNSIPEDQRLTYLINETSTGKVYLIQTGQRRWITNPATFNIYGYNWRDIVNQPSNFDSLVISGADVTFPILTRDSGPEVYFMAEGKKYWIANPETFSAWNFDWNQIVFIRDDILNPYPYGGKLTRVVTSPYETKVYFIENGQKRWFQKPLAVGAYGYDLGTSLSWVPDSVLAGLSEGPVMYYLIQIQSGDPAYDGKAYFIEAGKKRHIIDPETWNAWNFDYSDLQFLTSNQVNSYPDGQSLTKLPQDSSGRVYLMEAGVRRWIPDPVTFDAYFLSWSSIVNVSEAVFRYVSQGADLPKESLTLEGIPLPANAGTTAREQHLSISMPQEPAEIHYAISGTPEAARNGMAWETSGGSGFGAWGVAPSVENERYYIAMRWNYTNLHGQPIYASKN